MKNRKAVRRIAVVLAAAVAGFFLAPMGAGILTALAGLVAGVVVVGIEVATEKIPATLMTRGGIGLLVGLAVAFFLSTAIETSGMRIVIAILAGYLGVIISLSNREAGIQLNDSSGTITGTGKAGVGAKLLDTSVIIDGRIADVCDTGFIEGVLYTPRFVLQELQRIADSSDPLKRNRGRRGLDILNRMQKSNVAIEVLELDVPETREVDEKLLILGKQRGAKIVTNDYNLNKVAEIHGVAVLNINDLANALKPAVLPGELLTIRVIKEGKESGQGIGYLDDGTMVVVDNGKIFMGQKIDVVVTSALQTAAGRMIFAKKKDEAGDIMQR
jgi:uncharacterized protein YacL